MWDTALEAEAEVGKVMYAVPLCVPTAREREGRGQTSSPNRTRYLQRLMRGSSTSRTLPYASKISSRCLTVTFLVRRWTTTTAPRTPRGAGETDREIDLPRDLQEPIKSQQRLGPTSRSELTWTTWTGGRSE